MNRTVDSAAAEQRGVGSIHDRVDGERGDVCLDGGERSGHGLDQVRGSAVGLPRRFPVDGRSGRIQFLPCEHAFGPEDEMWIYLLRKESLFAQKTLGHSVERSDA